MSTVTIADLAEEAAAEAAQMASHLGHPVLATVAIPDPDAQPLALLANDTAGWWSQPGHSAAGCGVAAELSSQGRDRLTDLAEAMEALFEGAASRGHEPFAFTGAGFADGPYAEGWEPFAAASAWVPELAVIDEPGWRWLVATVSVGASEENAARQKLSGLLEQGTGPAALGDTRASASGSFTPDDAGHLAATEQALHLIEGGHMQKVVLARRFRTRSSTSAGSLVAALHATYPDFYGYAAVRDGSAFVGASPELLIGSDGRTLRSSPAAATVPSTGSPSADRKLAGGLDSVKSRWEQELVVDAVWEALEPLCERIRASLPMVISAGPVQHLSSVIEGTMRERVHVLRLAEFIHPTPAVCGVPREEALEFIAEAEGFDRGWYAGPIGIVHPNGDGTLAVALRGALLHDGVIDLFAGAGIVEGSVPRDELREVEMKLRSVASVLSPED
jgi:isochorismate synthase